MTEHRETRENTPENIRDDIQRRRSWAIGRAAIGNAIISGVSFAGGFLGGGNASMVEAIHDAGDTGTHALDMIGSRSKAQSAKKALRAASGWGIVISAGYFGWRAGVDVFSPDAETPGLAATTIQGGVAVANVAIHKGLHADQHDIAHVVDRALAKDIDLEGLEDDINLEGSHRHTLGDSIVSPLLFGSMAFSELTGRPEIANIGAAVGALATIGMNGELLLPDRFRPTQQS